MIFEGFWFQEECMSGRLGVIIGLEACYCTNISRACMEACWKVKIKGHAAWSFFHSPGNRRTKFAWHV